MTSEGPFVVGIIGGTGSGKSTVLSWLHQAFEEKACLHSMDNYYKAREEQSMDAQGVKNFDLPESIYLDAYWEDLRLLKQGVSIERKEYVYNNPKAVAKTILTHPKPLILAEGLFLMSENKIREEIDLSVFVEASDVKRLERRIKRDTEERNYPEEDVKYRFKHHTEIAFHKFILPYRGDCDFIFDNEADGEFSMQVLIKLIYGRLKVVTKKNRKRNNL